MLEPSERPLCEAFDVTVLDLDGVVYVGSAAVAGAAAALHRATERGTRLAYVTNNASRPPAGVEQKLVDLGMPVSSGDVVTSAQAAARLLSDELAPRSRVFLVGGEGLEEALRAEGLEPVTDIADDPVAVVQGYGPELPWSRVVAGAALVRRGVPWVASNTDMTFPTDDGLGPGNGTLVRLIAQFAEVEPRVAGKPSPPLLEETARRVGARNPLMVGDRLDTDIAGARAVGWPSLLVMTGVSGVAELVAAGPAERPTYVAGDLGGLLEAHRVPDRTEDGWTLGGWDAAVVAGRLEVTGSGATDHWWQVVAHSAWTWADRSGRPPEVDSLAVPAAADR